MRKEILISLIIFCFACNSQVNTFEISGILSNSKKDLIVLSELSKNEMIDIDSSRIDDNGYFILQGETTIPKFYIIKTAENNYITLIIKPGDKIKIEADANNLSKNYHVVGSDDSKLIKDLTDKINETIIQIDSLGKVFRENYNNPEFPEIKQKLDKTYIQIKENIRQYTFNFIENNTNSLASIMALYMQLTPRENVIDSKKDYKYFKMVDSVLYAKYPESDPVILLHEHLEEIESQLKIDEMINSRIGIGAIAPNIILPSPHGDTLSLHSLIGNYVLLDFWASWCSPCRHENPNLVAVYKKYHHKGFEIFQVSLDKTKDAWMKAIENDLLTWKHVSDLKYWNSSVVPLYNLQGIPANFLLDKEGKIIAKNLRGEDLHNKLEEIFK